MNAGNPHGTPTAGIILKSRCLLRSALEGPMTAADLARLDRALDRRTELRDIEDNERTAAAHLADRILRTNPR